MAYTSVIEKWYSTSQCESVSWLSAWSFSIWYTHIRGFLLFCRFLMRNIIIPKVIRTLDYPFLTWAYALINHLINIVLPPTPTPYGKTGIWLYRYIFCHIILPTDESKTCSRLGHLVGENRWGAHSSNKCINCFFK